MAGIIIPVIPRTKLSYATGSTGAGALEIIVARGIDLSTALEATLICRLHSAVLNGGTTPALQFLGRQEAQTSQDPGLDFTNAGTAQLDIGASAASVAMTNGMSPYVQLVPLGIQTTSPTVFSNFGIACRVIVKGTWGATAPTQFDVYVSIDLSLKS